MKEQKFAGMSSLTDDQLALIGIKSFDFAPEQYIRIKDVHYTLDEFNRIGEVLLGRNPNENSVEQAIDKLQDLILTSVNLTKEQKEQIKDVIEILEEKR